MLKPQSNSRARRRGQALILAVLVMLFAVLLSSAFLVVIGNTGRQIGRETDRSEASRNADKAVSFVVAQLRSAPNPDAYDPTQFAGALPSNTSERELYYSQLDKAMGWEAQNYIKFPNPLSSRQAPQFLVKSNLVTDDAEGGDKRFMLKITVIGLSSKNPETWSRRILYKTTNWNGATFSYANFVTSFDPDTQKPISSVLAPPVNPTDPPVNSAPAINSDLLVRIYAAKGQGNERVTYSPHIVDVGNTLMISDGQHQPVVGVLKNSTFDPATSIHTATLRVLQAGTATGGFAPNSKIALVGTLFQNTPSVDDDGNVATPEATTEPQSVVGVRVDNGNTDTTPFGNGSHFNNGLSAPLTTIFAARKPQPRAATFAGQNFLESSGPVSIGNPTPAPPAAPSPPQTINFVGVTTETPAPILQASAVNNQFLSASFDLNGRPQFIGADSPVAPVIAPRSVRPAPINMASYRNKARAAGLYINNPDDVEKFNGQPLGTSQLQRFWQRKSFPVASGGNVTPVSLAVGTTGARLCYGRPGVDAYIYPMPTGSLEQRGIRGWISPWEFLPRGTRIILNGTTLTVIQDPISDNSPNAPDLNKAFNSTTRSFSLINVAPPANGIICAEGNVRISGTWTGAPLTIVSGNNVYIEGNLTTPVVTPAMGQPYISKIALMGKRNVVLNPTQFVARPEGTVDTSVGKFAFPGSASMGTVTLTNIADANSFKLGDKVAVFAPNTGANGWRTIADITGAALTFATGEPAIADATALKIKLACDPPIVLIKGSVADSTTDFYEGKTTGTVIAPVATDDIRIQEFDPTTNPATVGTAYAYKFAAGGDTLARNVPFNLATGQGIGVAMRESVAKKNLIFTVQGGKDERDVTDPADDIDDDGGRNLESRTSATNPFELRLTPKSGAVTSPAPSPNYDTFDLTQLAPTPVPPVPTPTPDDSAAHFAKLKSDLQSLSPTDADPKTNRWRLILPAAVAPATVGVQDLLAARRLSVTSVSVAPALNAASDPMDPDEATPARIRVPLTPSVVLFSGTLATTSPDTTAISRIGSTFGFQQAAIDPAKETRFMKAADLAKDPVWDQLTPSGMANVVKYAQFSPSGDVAWTRDGSGDYQDQLPTYYISGLRFQKVAQDAGVPTQGNSIPATGTTPTTVKSNMTVQVDATIYAEGGSWFVVPAPATAPYDADPANVERNVEWRRPAYNITINGNISQMMTPTATVDYDDEPDADGVATGAMKRWTDSLSYQVTDGTNIKWQTIRYQAAPLPAFTADAMGNVILDVNGNPVQAPLPQLPASTEILYTYSN